MQSLPHSTPRPVLAVIVVAILTSTTETWGKAPNISVTSKGLTNCAKETPMPMELTNTSWTMPEPNVFVMSGCLVVSRTVDSSMVGFATLSMCEKSGKACSPIMRFSHPDMCQALSRDGNILNDMASHLESDFSGCPISPGKYCLPSYTYSVPNDTKCGDIAGKWQLSLKIIVPGKETLMCQNWRVSVEADCD